MTQCQRTWVWFSPRAWRAFFGKNLGFFRHWTWKPIFLTCWNKKYLKNIINCGFYNSAKYKLFYIPLSRTATRRKRSSIFILFQIDTVGFFSCSALSSTSAFTKEMFELMMFNMSSIKHRITKQLLLILKLNFKNLSTYYGL